MSAENGLKRNEDYSLMNLDLLKEYSLDGT